MIRIITDSVAEFTKEEALKYNIDVVPLTVTIGGKSYLDRVDLTPSEFYRLLEGDFAKTSQPNPARFEEVYRKYPGDDIISLHLSSKLSGTVSSARFGAEASGRDDIEVIDTLHAVNSLKNIILEAIKLRDEGKSKDEIVSEIKRLMEKSRILIALETLDYLEKGGRISKFAATASKLIKIKPILSFNDGIIVPIKKLRGMKKSLQYMADQIAEADIMEGTSILVSYSSNPANAEVLLGLLKDKGIEVGELSEFGPVVGTYTGFNAVVVSYIEK